jgi:hypothetical protein
MGVSSLLEAEESHRTWGKKSIKSIYCEEEKEN